MLFGFCPALVSFFVFLAFLYILALASASIAATHSTTSPASAPPSASFLALPASGLGLALLLAGCWAPLSLPRPHIDLLDVGLLIFRCWESL